MTQKSFRDDQPPPTHGALRELEARDDASALEALAEAVAIEDQFLRRTAIEVIGRHPRGRELQALVLSAFDDRSGYVVRTACDVVARWKLTEAHERVVALLAHRSVATRKVAIRALDAIWVDIDFTPIFRIYTSVPEIDLRREAAWVLRRHATVASWRMLFDTLGGDALPRHRQWACELAESFAGRDVLPELQRFCSEVDGHVRKSAAQAIERISSRNDSVLATSSGQAEEP